MCAKVAVGVWQRAGSQSVIWAHISHFLYCDSVTLCLAWGLPGLRWVLSECSFPSSTPLLATPLCWPTLFILKALRIPKLLVTGAFILVIRCSSHNSMKGVFITMIPFGSYKLRIREGQ